MTTKRPDTLDDLIGWLKGTLQANYSFTLQYQDPEFNNELCNPTNLAELPEKPTIKIIPMIELVPISADTELYSDTSSQADTEILSSSSLDISFQCPEVFDIPKFGKKSLQENFFDELDLFSPRLTDLFRKKKDLTGQLLTELLRQTKVGRLAAHESWRARGRRRRRARAASHREDQPEGLGQSCAEDERHAENPEALLHLKQREGEGEREREGEREERFTVRRRLATGQDSRRSNMRELFQRMQQQQKRKKEKVKEEEEEDPFLKFTRAVDSPWMRLVLPAARLWIQLHKLAKENWEQIDGLSPIYTRGAVPGFTKSEFLVGDAEREIAAESHNESTAEQLRSVSTDASSLDGMSLPVTLEGLCAAQRADPTLKTCFSSVVSADKPKGEQVVVPVGYRLHVLSVAHESQWSGYLPITKKYQLILKHFFWPGLKAGVVEYCRCCHVCQMADLHKVNAVTVPDSYPLPRMEDCVDNLGKAKYVSKLDLLKGYWQVPLTDRASNIYAFATPDNFLQYTVMAFGMCNSSHLSMTAECHSHTHLPIRPDIGNQVDDQLQQALSILHLQRAAPTAVSSSVLTLHLSKIECFSDLLSLVVDTLWYPLVVAISHYTNQRENKMAGASAKLYFSRSREKSRQGAPLPQLSEPPDGNDDEDEDEVSSPEKDEAPLDGELEVNRDVTDEY
ncbi:hypothetical protein F2P81_006374 [Scophthalmus maximus]|uniref:Gypsy retrotransposon integrase-like protein 1 n=1 Tax=Scophthalmus maximus TaxID=52904 RepID=A0A6A4SYZ2_SCOMX|nr:hypothetical protein F2P81_006374 [Scophthalmus maximus]